MVHDYTAQLVEHAEALAEEVADLAVLLDEADVEVETPALDAFERWEHRLPEEVHGSLVIIERPQKMRRGWNLHARGPFKPGFLWYPFD